MPNPEGGKELTKDDGQLTQEQQTPEQSVTEHEHPDVSQTVQPETDQSTELTLEPEVSKPVDKYHGKSREEVIEINSNYEKLIEEQRRQLDEAIKSQGVRTQGPDRIPQTTPNYTTPTQQQQVQEVPNVGDSLIEGNQEPLNQLIDRRFNTNLSQVIQTSQQLDQQQANLQQEHITNTLQSESRLIAAEMGKNPQDVYNSILTEYSKDADLVAEMKSNPHAFTDDRVRKGARELIIKSSSSRRDEILADLKELGVPIDALKKVKNLTKEVANETVPASNTNAGGEPVKGQYSAEDEETLSKLGLGLEHL